MVNSSLIEILKVLDKNEWHELKELLAPERYNRMLALLVYIEQYNAQWDSSALSKEKASKKLYPRAKYDDQRMREDMSYLNAFVKNYLTQKKLQSHTPTHSLATLLMLRERGALGVYEKQIKKTRVQLGAGYQDEQYLLNQVLLEHEAEQYQGQQPGREVGGNLQSRMEYLDGYYLLSKLKLYCEQLNRTQVLQTDYQPKLMKEILALAADKSMPTSPQIPIYFLIAQMLQHKNDENRYQLLKKELPKSEQYFEGAEVRNIYRYLQNYCIHYINQGNAKYFNELLDIYKRLLANKLLLTNNEIDHTDYKNIVTTGLRLKEFKWTDKFIEDYQLLIDSEVREGAYLYNKSNYYYESGQLQKASELLTQHNFSDIFYNMSARHLLLKIFFDQAEFEALDYQIESFRIYLMRNKIISAANKASNINFLKVMRRLSVAKRDGEYVSKEISAKRKTGIEKAIAKYQPLANKNWLLERAGELG